MALVAQYDLELYQMDVKTTFLNGDLEENKYWICGVKEIHLWIHLSFGLRNHVKVQNNS